MSVIIEDGSIVSGADSYITLDELRSFCKKRFVTLPESEEQLTALLILSFEYINNQLEDKFKGCRVSDEQEGSWPRKGICKVPEDTIPKAIKDAQCQLSIDCLNGGMTLTPNVTEYAVRSEKIGPMQTTYAIGSSRSSSTAKPLAPVYTKALAYLKPYMNINRTLYVYN